MSGIKIVGLRIFFHNKCASYEVQGSEILVFKEKMKKLKSDLKVWNRVVFNNVFQQGRIFKG